MNINASLAVERLKRLGLLKERERRSVPTDQAEEKAWWHDSAVLRLAGYALHRGPLPIRKIAASILGRNRPGNVWLGRMDLCDENLVTMVDWAMGLTAR